MASIDVYSGQEGPAHDPYAVSTILFKKTDGTEVDLVMGSLSGCKLFVNDEQVLTPKEIKLVPGEYPYELTNVLRNFEDQWLCIEFEKLTGLTPDKAEQLYNKHFYFEDPMGCAADYI